MPRLALLGIDGGGNSGTATGTLAFTGVGAGALYYTPTRWFGTASLLLQKLSWDGSNISVPSTVGAALSLSAGHDWQVSQRFSFGIVGQLHAGGVPDNAAKDGGWTTVAFCLGGIMNYD